MNGILFVVKSVKKFFLIPSLSLWTEEIVPMTAVFHWGLSPRIYIQIVIPYFGPTWQLQAGGHVDVLQVQDFDVV